MTRIKIALISLFLLLIYAETYAQNFNLNKEQSELTVEGNSSLHNWYLETTDMDGQINFDLDSVLHIKKLTLIVQVAGLKGKKKGMIKKMRGTLQSSKFSTIAYQFKRIDKITLINPRKFYLQTTGKLTIAGANKQIALKFLITVNDKSINILGKKNLKMTDFNITPPKALLGMLKTDNEVSLTFYVIYQ